MSKIATDNTLTDSPENKALNTLKNLLNSQKAGVLSTYDGDSPYANIIAFAVSDDFTRIIFASPKATKKVANMKEFPKAAFLVDNRSNSDDDFKSASALTAVGEVKELTYEERQKAESAYVKKHPRLESFFNSSESAVMAINVSKYILVVDFQNVVVFNAPL